MEEIVINCKPAGKGRPRFMFMGGRVHTYTPEKTRDLERLVAMEYKLQSGKHFGDAPLSVEIIASFEPPKSASKKKREELIKRQIYDKKPDADNIAKLVLDALNGVAYTDDKQIFSLHIIKVYAEKDGLKIRMIEKK